MKQVWNKGKKLSDEHNLNPTKIKTLIIGGRSGIGKAVKDAIPDSKLISSSSARYNYICENLVMVSGIGWFDNIENIPNVIITKLFRLNVINPIIKIKNIIKNNKYLRRIIFIGSNCAINGFPKNNVYAATKGAINALAINLHEELKPRNISISIIHPGTVNSPRFWHQANADNRKNGAINPKIIGQWVAIMIKAGENGALVREMIITPC